MQEIDKMSIKDWGTVEKIQRKFKIILLLSNIVEILKKIEEYLGKIRENFENL